MTIDKNKSRKVLKKKWLKDYPSIINQTRPLIHFKTWESTNYIYRNKIIYTSIGIKEELQPRESLKRPERKKKTLSSIELALYYFEDYYPPKIMH